MVKTFNVNIYSSNHHDIHEHVMVVFVYHMNQWYMQIGTCVNSVKYNYDNIKVYEELDYKFLQRIIHTICEANLEVITKEIGYTEKNRYNYFSPLSYTIIELNEYNFQKVLERLEDNIDYSEIESRWYNDDNAKFRLLYPNLLK